jgi:hypothetical protein
MTQTSNSTKTAAEAHVSGPRDDDIKQRMREVELALQVLVEVDAHANERDDDDLYRDARTKAAMANLQCISDLCWAGEAYRAGRQSEPPPSPPPDGLRTPAEATRKPRLAGLLKQAAEAGKSVKGAEVYKDRIVLQFGEPAPTEPDNPWPLDEFRTKETKQ